MIDQTRRLPMLSNWRVRDVHVAGTTFYQVYRLTDAASKKDREETRGGYWITFGEAQALADKLNEGKPYEVRP